MQFGFAETTWIWPKGTTIWTSRRSWGHGFLVRFDGNRSIVKFGVLNTAACFIAPRTCAGGGDDDGGGGGGGGDTTFIFAPAPSACRPSSSQPHRPCPYVRPSQCAVSEGTTASGSFGSVLQQLRNFQGWSGASLKLGSRIKSVLALSSNCIW